jgi:hypothetical protein
MTAAYGYIWDICPSFAECLYTRQKANNVPSSPFVQYAHSGNLPDLSIVARGGTDAAFSEHNGLSITAGDDWLGQVASAVMNGPEWRSTVLFITWDGCGCFHDQVRPGPSRTARRRGRASPWSSSALTPGRATPTRPRPRSPEYSPTPSRTSAWPLGGNDARTYPFASAFKYKQAPLRPVPMIYRCWPRDAYHVSMAEASQDT